MQQGEQLMRIGAFDERARIRVAVPGADVKQVEPGMVVEIQLRSFLTPSEQGVDDVLRGKVARVAPRSETYKNANVFMADVYISLPPPDAEGQAGNLRELLKPGMTGKVRILKEEKSTYLKIYARSIKNKIDYWMF